MPINSSSNGNFSDSINYKNFAFELKQLRIEAKANIDQSDLKHLQKVEWWGRICTLLGYLTAWIFPNPLSAYLIAQGNVARWTIVTHHVMHKGYDRVPDVPPRYTSKHFGKGWRRFLHWFDWMIPEAWDFEHNILHHFHTGESTDPDLVEETFEHIRNSKLPMFVRYLIIGFFLVTWKWTYYAPVTLLELNYKKSKSTGPKPKLQQMFNPFKSSFWELVAKCYLPYGGIRFILIPAFFLLIGWKAALFVLLNSLLAELIANIYSFLIIVPNHAGEDLYRFDTPVRDKDEFLVRQVIGSVNFKTGGEVNDFLHGWLNYQIEHHLFPDLPASKYRDLQPRVKEICARNGVPYVQEGLWIRVRKMLHIMVGKDDMNRIESVPIPQVVAR